jgi:hypothetical protein
MICNVRLLLRMPKENTGMLTFKFGQNQVVRPEKRQPHSVGWAVVAFSERGTKIPEPLEC